MHNLILFILTLALDHGLTIKSSAFESNAMIPARYTCSGQNISPELSIIGVPGSTKSMALIMDDPDAPDGGFDHWIMWNIPVSNSIKENSAPGKQGHNGKKENSYTGPCPPSGTHHYHFKVYALDATLNLDNNSDKKDLEKAMKGHIIAQGELIGLYKK